MRTKSEVLNEHYGTESFFGPEGILSVMRADRYASTPPPLNKWVTMKLPYEAPEHPGIPSMEEIEHGMRHNSLTQPTGLFPVCRVGKCVVKMGSDPIILQEAENLLFVQEHSQVRTPKLYAAFLHQRPIDTRQCYYLVTEFIEGDTLSEKFWLGLGDEAQKIICSRLSEQFQLLRSIPSEGYYGRVYHQGWTPRLPPLRIRCKEMCGPYQTFKDLISAMYASAELCLADSDVRPDYHPIDLGFLSQFKPILGGTNGHRPVLTHLDPKWENIIVRPVKEDGDDGKIKDWDVVLIDWDTLGWLPEFMQVAALYHRIMLEDEPKKTFMQRVSANFEDSYTTEVEFLEKISLGTMYALL